MGHTDFRAGSVGNPSLTTLEVIVDWPEGRDLEISLKEEVGCAEEAALFNKLPENYTQYVLLSDGSCHIVRKPSLQNLW